MSYFLVKEYIKFWIHARTAHGIHSPFIYNMVTKCLRNHNVFIQTRFYTESIPKKYNVLLNRILSFYGITSISTDYERNFEVLISQNFKNSEKIIQKLENNQFWFLLNIRKNKQTLKKWEKIIQHSDIEISIDLFLIGIILKRKEQSKEHFQLKPKF
ncbi:MAG: hypothetical protein ACK5MD_02290 [Flavobacteriales bacterium]